MLTTSAYSQDSSDPSRLSGKELSEAWSNRATTADEAITNLVRGYLAEQNVGTPKTAIHFIPYKNVPIDEECQTILKGKDYRLSADELPSRVTLQWGKSPAGGLTVGTTLRYELNDRRREDNALKYFSYPTLVAIPLGDGTYHAQVLIPTGPTLSQLAAVGKLYETGKAVRLDRSNSDYDSIRGSVWAVKLDDDVQRVLRDYFLPLESFVSHPKHAPRQQKSRFKIGYFKDLDVAFVVQSRVYDVFLIRRGRIQLSRSEPWTYIHNAKSYNNPAYQKRLASLCVTVFPKPKAKVAAAQAARPTAPGFARTVATEIVSPPRPGPASTGPVVAAAETDMPRPMDYWLEQHPGWIDRLNGGIDTDLLKTDYNDVGN
jgi:hypothetical protein